MVCRKNSFGYTDYIHTRFASSNVRHVRRLVDEMTIVEKNNLRTKPFEWLWKDMWLGNVDNNLRTRTGGSGSDFAYNDNGGSGDPVCADGAAGGCTPLPLFHERDDAPSSHKKRFESIHPSILRDAIDASTTQWITPEWEFPKGRRNFNERDVLCALREFEEETGISRDEISVVDNMSPFEEIFIGSDHKSYKYRYFLAVARTEVISVNFQRSEISGMEWKTVEQCCQCIRPYNVEKHRLICMIDQILRTQILR